MSQNTDSQQRKWRSFLGTVLLFGLLSLMAASVVSPPDPYTQLIVTALFEAIGVVVAFIIIYVLGFDILPSIDSSSRWAVIESERNGSHIQVSHDLVTGGTSLVIDGEQTAYTSKLGAMMLAYIIISLVGGIIIGAWYGI